MRSKIENLLYPYHISGAEIDALMAVIFGEDEELAKRLHYPECWDTAAYPTLHDALLEVTGNCGCSECDPASAVHQPSACAWTHQDDPDRCFWQGDCGIAWVFPEAVPSENDLKFCPKCGKPVSVQKSYYDSKGTLRDPDGSRSVFDDLDACEGCGLTPAERERQENPEPCTHCADQKPATKNLRDMTDADFAAAIGV
jgi:hypothetical protein